MVKCTVGCSDWMFAVNSINRDLYNEINTMNVLIHREMATRRRKGGSIVTDVCRGAGVIFNL